MLDSFRRSLDSRQYTNRLATSEEAAKFRLLFEQLAQMRSLVESFDREHYLQTILAKTSAAMLASLTSFRENFNSLAVELNLSHGDVLVLNPSQFAMNHREDIDFIIRELRSVLETKQDLREVQKELLRQRMFELTRMKAQNCSSGQLARVLMKQEIDERLEKYQAWVCAGSDFQCDVQIGRGGFSDVFLGYRQSTGETVAVKVLHCNEMTLYDLDMLDRELSILSSFEHPCLLPFVGLVRSPNYCIVTEYMSNDSLFRRLHDEQYQREPLDATQKTIIAIGVAHGMDYLHSRRLIHRDLKSLNILLDDMMYPRIGDFGLSRRRADTNDVMTKGVGTSQWMAPEVITSQQYDEKADVYSFAIVLWEMETHQVPWQDCWDVSMAMNVATQGKRLPIPNGCPKALSELIQACWDGDPEKRPSFHMIVTKFDAGEIYFDGADMKVVDEYLMYLKDREPNDEALVDLCNKGDFQAYLDRYGKDAVISQVLDMIEKTASAPNVYLANCTQLIDQLILARSDLRERFREQNGIKKLVKMATEPEFVVTPELITIFSKVPGDVDLDHSLLEVLNHNLLSESSELRKAVVNFLQTTCSQEVESLFVSLIPNLVSNLRTNDAQLRTELLCLFEKMIEFEELAFGIHKYLDVFCGILAVPSYETQEKVLLLMKKDVARYSASTNVCNDFVFHLSKLLENESLRESTLYVLTLMVNNDCALPALSRLEHIPLIDMLNTTPVIIIQSLKILLVYLVRGYNLRADDVRRIQPLLGSRDDDIANIAAMCLTASREYYTVIDGTLPAYFERALESENGLTLQALRLCGSISQTKEGQAVIVKFEKQICSYVTSKDKQILKTCLLVLAAMSFVDQQSENLVSVTKAVVDHLGDADTSEAALIFVSNMTVNYEAVLLAAPCLPRLVKTMQSGDLRCMAPIHRIITLHECYSSCKSCLNDLVRSCEPFIDTDFGSVVCEIFDALARHDEAKAVIRNSEIPELLQEKLHEMDNSDPNRPTLLRLVYRLK